MCSGCVSIPAKVVVACAVVRRALLLALLLGVSRHLLLNTPIHALSPSADSCILISEVMIDPVNIDDKFGEWVELANICDTRINIEQLRLAVWRDDKLVSTDVIERKLVVEPGQYVVLAREDNLDQNGSVRADFELTSLYLPDQLGELRIQRDNTVIDSVAWEAESAQPAPVGASLERQGATRQSAWAPARNGWPGSKGNLGSPGAPFTATLPPPDTPAPTAAAIVSPTPSPTQTPVPTVQPFLAEIRISEIMANPAAVEDIAGEWFELYNAGEHPVNLRDCLISDLDTDSHTISADLWVQPKEYIVLGRNGDPNANGGVAIDYVYSGVDLANASDELILSTPSGTVIDRLDWGTEPLRIREGASLERTGFGDADAWIPGATLWPNSAGDLGSPGAAYRPAPAPTPTQALATKWSVVSGASALVIDEAYVRESDYEYIVLANVSPSSVDLTGWSIGDAEAPGDSEGLHALPAGRMLTPGSLFIIARNGEAFRNRWGVEPDAELAQSMSTIPTLDRISGWSTGSFALNDNGDEILLLNPAMQIADAVAYGDGQFHAVQLTGALRIPNGYSLQRVPGYRYPETSDVRHRFLTAPPQPSTSRQLPQAVPGVHPPLDDGFVPVWGTLGARSNFSADGAAPPHYIAAAAAANRLDFIAIADANTVHANLAALSAPSATVLPAWRWTNNEGAEAIVYGADAAQLYTWSDLRVYLETNGYVAQALVNEPPLIADIAAVHADDTRQDYLKSLYKRWRSTQRPLLPAGNANPPYNGADAIVPRYTGLAVKTMDARGLLDAIAERRGWLTSEPGLALTLRVENGPWMGNTLDASENVNLRIRYYSSKSEAAGLALWENDRPLRQFQAQSGDATWTVSVPFSPGAVYYAVATQLDGDFAVTSPLMAKNADSDTHPLTPPGDHDDTGRTGEDKNNSNNDSQQIVIAKIEQGEATGPPGSLAAAKLQGLKAYVEFRAQVTAPPGLYNSAIYVAEPAAAAEDIAGLGIQVYLRSGDFMQMAEGDWVQVRGTLHSFRGELEVFAEKPDHVWRFESDTPLRPLPVRAYEVGETLEGRLVTFTGTVTGWKGDSFYVCDPERPELEAKVTVRSSLDWRRPYVNEGEVWQVTGVVSQFAKEHPWNGGYRVLARYEDDLIRLVDR